MTATSELDLCQNKFKQLKILIVKRNKIMRQKDGETEVQMSNLASDSMLRLLPAGFPKLLIYG